MIFLNKNKLPNADKLIAEKPPMITGDLSNMTLRQGYNAIKDRFWVQMTEVKRDDKGNKYAGQEMRIYLTPEFFKAFHGEHANMTEEDTAKNKAKK